MNCGPNCIFSTRAGHVSGIWCFLGECFPRPELEAALHTPSFSFSSVETDLVPVPESPPYVEQAHRGAIVKATHTPPLLPFIKSDSYLSSIATRVRRPVLSRGSAISWLCDLGHISQSLYNMGLQAAGFPRTGVLRGVSEIVYRQCCRAWHIINTQ